MVINGNQIALIEEFEFPNGIHSNSTEEFEKKLLESASVSGLKCFITHDELSYDGVTALIGMGATECIRISQTKRKENVGFARKALRQALANVDGDLIITFPKNRDVPTLLLFRVDSAGALNDVLHINKNNDEIYAKTGMIFSFGHMYDWTEQMTDCVRSVANACR